MRPDRQTLLATFAVLGAGLATGPRADAVPLAFAGASTTAIPAQTVQATVQPNTSQAVLIPVPPNTDLTKVFPDEAVTGNIRVDW